MSDIERSPYGFGNAPRGQDPMGSSGRVTDSYQPHPMAKFVGQLLDQLQDPRVGMAFPGAGLARMGFRATDPRGMAALRATDQTIQRQYAKYGGAKPWEQIEVTQPGVTRQGLSHGMIQNEPTPFQQAGVMRQGDNGMAHIKAHDDLRQSMGWTEDQYNRWRMSQQPQQ